MKHFLVLICVLLPLISFAQPDTLWTRRYGGTDGDWCSSALRTMDGGFVLAGSTYSFGAGGSDYWIVKVDSTGDSLWSHTYGGPDFDQCDEIVQAADGGYFLVGHTYVGLDNHDILLVKVDAQGDSVWGHTYGGNESENCRAIESTPDGGCILAGRAIGQGLWLIRVNSDGQTLWSRYHTDRLWMCYRIRQEQSGSFLLAGQGGWVLRINEEGDSLWSRRYGGPEPDYFFDFVWTEDSCIVFVGDAQSFGAGAYDFWLVKTNAQGDTEWTNTWGGPNGDDGIAIAQTRDGGFVVAGSAGGGSWWPGQDWVIRTNAQGDVIWNRTFGSQGSSWSSVFLTEEGGYVLAGNSIDSDFWLLKTGPDPVSSAPNSIPHPSSFILSAFPNPFNPSTTVSFSLPRTSNVSLAVYDVTGRKLGTLIEKSMSAGEHSVNFDGSALPSSLYFARLTAGEFAQTQKMVLLK